MSRISPVLVAEAFLLKDKEILRLRAEIEKLRLELDMQRATTLLPSQKYDRAQIDHLNAALVAALDEAAKLRAALKLFQPYSIPKNAADTDDLPVLIGDLRAAADALKETGG